MDPRLRKLSKFLVYLCRHGASSWEVDFDMDGWVKVADMLTICPIAGVRPADVKRVVNDVAGNRLELNINRTAIRAVQGHSLPIRDDGYVRVTLDDDTPELLVHGTNDAGWLSIQEQGLKPMQRQHVHLARGENSVRAASTVHIYVKKAAVINSGLELLIASSGAILCRSTIPPTCFQSAWHVTQQKELLNVEEEEWVVKEEVESNTRWKQIRLGKWTYEYTVWKYSTDEEKAWFPIPKPPDSSDYALPKRQWLKELSAWRRGLHQFQERLQAWHREVGKEMPPVKKARGSVAQSVPFFSSDPGASSSTDVTPPWRRR